MGWTDDFNQSVAQDVATGSVGYEAIAEESATAKHDSLKISFAGDEDPQVIEARWQPEISKTGPVARRMPQKGQKGMILFTDEGEPFFFWTPDNDLTVEEPEGVIFVDPAGTADASGSTNLDPMSVDSALALLADFGPVLSETWEIRHAPGVYEGGVSTPKGLTGLERLHIYGPDVSHGVVPLAVYDAAGHPFALRVDNEGYAQVKNLKAINTSISGGGGTASAFLGEKNSDVWWENCHSDGALGPYAGITATEFARSYIESGKITGAHVYGLRMYGKSIFTCGYDADLLGVDSPIIEGYSDAGILAQDSYGDVFYTDLGGAGGGQYGSLITTNGRIRFQGSKFRNALYAAVKAQEGSRVVLYDGSNILDPSNAAELILAGGSTELTMHKDAVPEFRHSMNMSQAVFTGGVANTATNLRGNLYNVITAHVGKMAVVEVYGTMAGPGTKTVGVRFLSSLLLEFASSANFAGKFRARFYIHFTGIATQFVYGEYYEDSGAGGMVRLGEASKTFAITTGQALRFYGALSDVTGSITPKATLAHGD
jgi:hypothetical protein